MTVFRCPAVKPYCVTSKDYIAVVLKANWATGSKSITNVKAFARLDEMPTAAVKSNIIAIAEETERRIF